MAGRFSFVIFDFGRGGVETCDLEDWCFEYGNVKYGVDCGRKADMEAPHELNLESQGERVYRRVGCSVVITQKIWMRGFDGG